MHKISNKFEFWPDRTTDYGVSCLERLKISHRLIMGKWCLHASFDRIIIKVAGNQDRHESSVKFDFRPNQAISFWSYLPLSDIKLFILVGLGRSFFVCCLAHTVGFLLLQVVLFDTPISIAKHFCRVLIFASSVFICDLFVSRDDIDELENLHADRTTVCFEP